MTYIDIVLIVLVILQIGVILYLYFAPMTPFKEGFISGMTLEFCGRRKVIKYVVEFIQKIPSEVTNKDKFLVVECDTGTEAAIVEQEFHHVGWVARVVQITTKETRNYPTSGLNYL